MIRLAVCVHVCEFVCRQRCVHMCVHGGCACSHRVYGGVYMEACVCVQECVGVPWWVHMHKYEHESVGVMSGGVCVGVSANMLVCSAQACGFESEYV